MKVSLGSPRDSKTSLSKVKIHENLSLKVKMKLLEYDNGGLHPREKEEKKRREKVKEKSEERREKWLTTSRGGGAHILSPFS